MKIKMYPRFEEVFTDHQLKGIFYPLCTLVLPSQEELHFVSHNGLWTQCHSLSAENTDAYIRFTVVEGKYEFEGDVGLYKGYQNCQRLCQVLEEDFKLQGSNYLKSRVKTEAYIAQILPLLEPCILEEFDIETYLSFFYSFHFNRLNFQENGVFGQFMHAVYAYGKADKSPVIYQKGEELFAYVVENSDVKEELPSTLDFTKFVPLGLTVGMEFFTDGNDCLLLYNAEDQEVLCANVYN